MSNKWGKVQAIVYRPDSDTPAVIGTAGTIRIDGRKRDDSAREAIAGFARGYAAREGLEWRGTVYLLGGRYVERRVI